MRNASCPVCPRSPTCRTRSGSSRRPTGSTFQLCEYVGALRHIFTNGTPHPPGHIDWWMGDSRGRWEGDTRRRRRHSLQRPRRGSTRRATSTATCCMSSSATASSTRGHLDYEVTIEDPKVFTRPWKMQMPLYRRVEQAPRVLEYYCYGFSDVFELPAGR